MDPDINEMLHDLEPSKLRQILLKMQEALNEAHIGLDWFHDIVRTHMEQQKREAEGNPADPFDISEDDYRRTCAEIFVRDGDLEMDAKAEVSVGDDPGAYVQVWKWVSNAFVRKVLQKPRPVCRVCGRSLIHDPDGSPGVIVHADIYGEPDRERDSDHAGVPEIGVKDDTK